MFDIAPADKASSTVWQQNQHSYCAQDGRCPLSRSMATTGPCGHREDAQNMRDTARHSRHLHSGRGLLWKGRRRTLRALHQRCAVSIASRGAVADVDVSQPSAAPPTSGTTRKGGQLRQPARVGARRGRPVGRGRVLWLFRTTDAQRDRRLHA